MESAFERFLISFCFFFQHSMIYFYHHYELPYVLQQAQLQQVIIQRQQQQQQQQQQPQPQQQNQHHQHQHQPAAGDGLRPDAGSPLEVTLRPVQHFSIMNGLNNLGRLRGVLLRRRRARATEPPPTPTPPQPPSEQSTSQTAAGPAVPPSPTIVPTTYITTINTNALAAEYEDAPGLGDPDVGNGGPFAAAVQ